MSTYAEILKHGLNEKSFTRKSPFTRKSSFTRKSPPKLKIIVTNAQKKEGDENKIKFYLRDLSDETLDNIVKHASLTKPTFCGYCGSPGHDNYTPTRNDIIDCIMKNVEKLEDLRYIRSHICATYDTISSKYIYIDEFINIRIKEMLSIRRLERQIHNTKNTLTENLPTELVSLIWNYIEQNIRKQHFTTVNRKVDKEKNKNDDWEDVYSDEEENVKKIRLVFTSLKY